jgi:hypothetical protein
MEGWLGGLWDPEGDIDGGLTLNRDSGTRFHGSGYRFSSSRSHSSLSSRENEEMPRFWYWAIGLRGWTGTTDVVPRGLVKGLY